MGGHTKGALFIMTGIGGDEYVFSKIVDTVNVGTLSLRRFEIQIGAMDYKFQLDGIVGMDFLLATKAKIDCEKLVLTK